MTNNVPGNIVEQINLTKTFFLVSAIVNLVFALGWIIYVVIFGLFTCGLMCLFGIIPVINVIACVMDFIAYNKLNGLDQRGTYNTLQFASIFDIITILSGNPASMIFGILTLINIGNPEMKNYFVSRGIY